MKVLYSLISGLAGSITLTVLHQCLVKTVKHSPRMDRLGMEVFDKTLTELDLPGLPEEKLYNATLLGDVAGNAAYYALAGLSPKHSQVSGSVLGIAAGAGAIALPEKLGLNPRHSNATTQTKALTLVLYLAGGLVAGSVFRLLSSTSEPVRS